MKKIGKISLGIVIALVLSIVFVIVNHIRFVEVSDSDLIYQPTKIDDSKNAFIALLPTLKQIKKEKPYEQLDTLIKDKNIDYSEATKVVDQYFHYLNAFSGALKFNILQLPIEENPLTPNKERYSRELNFLRKLQALHIELLLQKDNVGIAFQEMLTLFKYGYLLQNSDGGLLYFVLGTIVKVKALDLILDWVQKTSFDSVYYREMLKDIKRYADNNSMVKGFKFEYMFIKNILENLQKEASDYAAEIGISTIDDNAEMKRSRYFFNVNATLNAAAKFFRQEIKNIDVSYADIRHKNIYRPSNLITQYLYMLGGNAVGKTLLLMVTPRLEDRVEQKVRVDAKCNLTMLFLAIRAYYSDNNDLPESLGELVPDYIESVPEDPFDNKNLRYSKSKGIIYSIDKNMKDDKGNKEKDLRIKVDFEQEEQHK